MRLINYTNKSIVTPARPNPIKAKRFAKIDAQRLVENGFSIAWGHMGRWSGLVAIKDDDVSHRT
jgi:hypothetical protein